MRLFVGIAAFFAALMNWNFIMAGSASTNGLMLAWKTAGYYGLDRFALTKLGTPWRSKAPEAPVQGKGGRAKSAA